MSEKLNSTFIPRRLCEDKATGVKYLYDVKSCNRSVSRIFDTVNEKLAKITTVLEKYSYSPITENVLRGVISVKRDQYLIDLAIEDFHKWAKLKEYPSYLIADGEKRAAESINANMRKEVCDLVREIYDCIRESDEPLALESEDLSFHESAQNIQLNSHFLAKIQEQYKNPVTDQDIADAEAFLAILPQLREIDRHGTDITRLTAKVIGNRYISEEEQPTFDAVGILDLMHSYPIECVRPERYKDDPDTLAHLATTVKYSL